MLLALALGAFVLAFVIGTLTEYGMHRLMHKRVLLGKRHLDHHRDGSGQGGLGEFRDYIAFSLLALLGTLLLIVLVPAARPFAAGFLAGDVTQMVLAAWSHQI